MAKNPSRRSLPPGNSILHGLSRQIRLVTRLVMDRRVNPLIKVLPVLSLAYLVVPDLLFGPIDDFTLLWLGTYLFVELCPPEVVAEHQRNLDLESAGGGSQPAHNPDEVIDAEFRDLDP